MVGGVKTKARTNPHPLKKPDPAWIPQRLWHHPPLENHLSRPWLQFPKNCSITQMYATCTEISNNCKWGRGREWREQTRISTAYLGPTPTSQEH